MSIVYPTFVYHLIRPLDDAFINYLNKKKRRKNKLNTISHYICLTTKTETLMQKINYKCLVDCGSLDYK